MPIFADRRQRLAGGEAAHLAEAPRALDIRRIEMREDLVASRLDYRRVGITHAVRAIVGPARTARPDGEFTGFRRCPATGPGLFRKH